jgi:signal transduction histidine kinase
MYRSLRLKLTFLYSALFFILFWSLSLGLYIWMTESLGEGYITQVRERHQSLFFPEPFDKAKENTVTIAGTVALEQLQEIILILNGLLLFIIPAGSWFLTTKTLEPTLKAHEEQKKFVSDASHEMRTPLSILSGEMEVVLKKNRKAEEYKRIIASSKQEIDRLSRLVESLLFLARNDAVNYKIKPQKVDITDLLNSIIKDLNRKITDKKIKVIFSPTKQTLEVNGQDAILRTLFLNILDNALKYAPEKGKIWIKVFNNKGDMTVKIKDNGPGIDLADREKIFNRFYRVDESRSRTKGFGLGLSITKSIVEKYCGKITVDSQLGKGSTFTVYLPKVCVRERSWLTRLMAPQIA